MPLASLIKTLLGLQRPTAGLRGVLIQRRSEEAFRFRYTSPEPGSAGGSLCSRRRRVTQMDAEESRSEAVRADGPPHRTDEDLGREKCKKRAAMGGDLPAIIGEKPKDALKHFRALLANPCRKASRQLTNPNRDDRRGGKEQGQPGPPKEASKKNPRRARPRGVLPIWSYKRRMGPKGRVSS